MLSGVTTQCEECGTGVYRPPSMNPARWCSWKCRVASPRVYPNRRTPKVSEVCLRCGVPYMRLAKKSTRKFCSVGCATRYNARAKTVSRVTVMCGYCGELCTHGGIPGIPPSVAVRKKFCSRRCVALGRPIRGTSKIADDAIELWRSTWTGPSFTTEHRVGRWSIDLAFLGEKLAIELDGIYWHSLPAMIEKDARKDEALASNGWSIHRITMDKDSTPASVAEDIANATKDLIWTRC